VVLSNLAWLIFPLLIIGRMWGTEHPFTRTATGRQSETGKPARTGMQTEWMESAEAGQ
jgi:hypothetical protein